MLTRDNTTSLQYDNVEYIGEINNSPMIEVGVTKNKNNGQLKYDSTYLLNDTQYILQDKPPENDMNDDNKMYKNVEKVLFLTTQLLHKGIIIEMMKKELINIMKNYL